MTTKTSTSEIFHFFSCLTVMTAGGFVPDSLVTHYGQELVVTHEIRQLNTDTAGNCWLDLADDESAQRRRWGKVLFRRGNWPNDVSRLERGSDEWLEAAAAARAEAWKVESESERARRLRDIDTEFGPPPTSSRTLQAYGSGSRGDD
jgi:hypothetical protein